MSETKPNDFAYLTILLSIAILLVTRVMLVTTQSIDFAAHLSLVDFIAKNADVPRWTGGFGGPNNAPHLVAMAYYPPISHAAGAVAGWLFGTPIVGMNAVALTSVMALYAILVRVCLRASSPICAVAFLILALTIGPLGFLHGGELIQNYFYAQAFGAASTMFLLYALVFHTSGWASIAGAVAGTTVLGWVFPFYQVEFSACFLVYLTACTVSKSISDRSVAWGLVTQTAVAFVLLLAVTVMHPEFRVMMSIAGINGGLFPAVEVRHITVLAGLLMISGAFIFYKDLASGSKLGTFLAALAIGVSAVYLLQWSAAHVLHIGTPYSLKKHVFDVATTLCLVLAYCASLPFKARIVRYTSSLSILAGLVITLTIFTAAPSPTTNLKNTVNLQKVASNLMSSRVPADAYGTTIAQDANLSASPWFVKVLNMGVSVTEMGMPFGVAADYYYANDRTKALYSLTSSDKTREDCRVSRPTDLSVVLVNLACEAALP